MVLAQCLGGNMTAAKPKTSLGLIALIVFIDMAGIGLILPVMPSLLMGIAKVPVDRAAEIGGMLLFSYAVMQFLFAPIIGGLSDRFGRRPVLLITLAALGIDYLLMAWSPTLLWLFIGRIISGVMGATWAAANSCIADSVDADDRGRVFGLMGGAGAAGFVLGPAIGGVLGQYGDRIPFICAAVLVLVTAAAGYFILGETLPKEKRRAFSVARANPLGSILQMAKTPLVLGCLITIFFMQMSVQAQFSIWGYYGTLKFGWDTRTIGLTVSLFGILLAVAQALLVGKCIARFGPARTAIWSLIFGIPSYFVLAFAGSTQMMVLGIFIGSVTGLTFPAMQSMMSAKIAEDAQGELQGAIASMVSMTSVIGPPLMTNIFGAFADKQGVYFPGAPFLLSAVFLAVAVVLLSRTLRRFAQ
jgi:MFS transporter, DHA1 family, tetracycline resistance protein